MSRRYSRIKNPITLYFHRLDHETKYYKTARTLPQGIFLSDNYDIIKKEACELKRRVWKVTLLDKYIEKIKENYFFINKNCPIISIESPIEQSE